MSDKKVLVSVERLNRWHRDFDACQRVIHYAGGFDPAYVEDAQKQLTDIRSAITQAERISDYDLERIRKAVDGESPEDFSESVDIHDIGTLVNVITKYRADIANNRRALTFVEFSEVNTKRCNESFFPIESKDGPWWGNAMAGECGEACNIVKKISCDGMNQDLLYKLGAELADVVHYADLLATSFGLDLGTCVARKFNVVSDRVNSPLKIDVPSEV